MANTIIMSKYQGLGNDYLILDPKKNQVQLQGKKIALLCQRGFGLGADGVLYGPVEIDGKLGVRIFNADGSESAISGNGVRIFAKYLMDNGYITEKKFDIETMSGTIHVECLNSRATEFKVNIGKPSFISSDIPVSGEVREVIKENFVFHGKEYKATCLTVGNPHCIIFTDNVSAEAVKNLGPYVENADEFPERMNLQICRQVDKGNLEIEIWERGSGYTKASGTGSCAAAASKAAAYMLLTGKAKNKITIQTPKGIAYTADITDIKRSENEVSCAVIKDGGDDPDVTTGAYIYASVRILHSDTCALCKKKQDLAIINIDGGDGVGRVTKPGLDQPVGNAAINHVPREMIEKEVREVCELLDFKGTLDITISVPKGKELAEKTFNPRLGIVDGISILGTSGIVEPMSSQALIDTIRVELRQRYSFGYDYVAVAPGNYGLDFMKESYGYDLDRSVKCSNFIGETIDMAADMGFKRMLLTGHIGKLIKVAGGIMNTHSREADCRIELLTAFAFKCDVAPEYIKRIMDSLTTEETLAALKESGRLYEVMDYAMERICFYLDKRAKGRLEIDCIMYSNEFGELAKSRKAEKWFTLLAQEQAQQI